MEQLGYPTSASEMLDRLNAILTDNDYHTFVAELAEGAASVTPLSASQAQAVEIAEPRVVGMIGLRIGILYEKNGLHGHERSGGYGVGGRSAVPGHRDRLIAR